MKDEVYLFAMLVFCIFSLFLVFLNFKARRNNKKLLSRFNSVQADFDNYRISTKHLLKYEQIIDA